MIMQADRRQATQVSGPVAIFGWGISGQAAAMLLSQHGIEYEVFDQDGRNITRNSFTREDAQNYNTVVYSPGFRQNHPWFELARASGCRCLGELDFASLFLKTPVIAVTGTNGKTTLTEFITHALNKSGVQASAAGNLGYSLSRLANSDEANSRTAVCEISSFQAESLGEMKLDALLWTNFSEDHLDQHLSMREYFEAKWNLLNCLQKEVFIVGESVAKYAEEYGLKLPDYVEVVDREDAADIPADSVFNSYPQQENYLVAKRYWEVCGYNMNVLKEAALDFELPHHRLQKMLSHNGIEFWNDSKATNFSSAVAALRAFDKPVYWIGGGKCKGGDVETFATRIRPHIKEAFLIGDVAGRLGNCLQSAGCTVHVSGTMDKAIEQAGEMAEPGSVILLSPGFSSFDQFDNYQQRGMYFENTVNQYIGNDDDLPDLSPDISQNKN